MALLLQPGYEASGQIKVDIIGIPAIGADPSKAFVVDGQPWFPTLYQDIPNARVFLYDHLTPEERAIEVKPWSDPDHEASVDRNAEAENALASFDISQWANRLLHEIASARDTKGMEQRPIIFICHSTGGIILKKALCRKARKEHTDLAALCVGITFFATPHRGSSILSKQEFSRAIQDTLNLKWEMSELLRSQLSLEHPKLELLNHMFGSHALGIPIWNYVETLESRLDVLTESANGQALAEVEMKIVDPQSAEISFGLMNALMEAEEFNLNTHHAGTARLADDQQLYDDYREALRKLVQSTNAQERRSHHDLITSIKDELQINLSQFYQIVDPATNMTTTAVWSEKAPLANVLALGIDRALQKRLEQADSFPKKYSVSKPIIQIRGPTEVSVVPSRSGNSPDVVIQPIIEPTGRKDKSRISQTLSPDSIQVRGPSFLGGEPRDSIDNSSIESTHVHPHPVGEPAPQHAHALQTPFNKRDKFQWIHVPACVPGLVPKIMAALEKDKKRPDLHKKVLMDQNWLSIHNKSRHASSHARFVRTFFKLLMPRSSAPTDEVLTPTATGRNPQCALYMPYMHWDTYAQMKARADILRKRRELKSARPVDRKVLKSPSLEHKLIWQFLNLGSSSIHVRRTLDQYGFPSLRDIEARDNDQVLYKKTRPAKAASQALPPTNSHREMRRRAKSERRQVKTLETGTACVLMVDQLWCWVLAEDLIVTFFSPKEGGEGDDSGSHSQADVLTNIHKAVNGDYATQLDDCYDFAALVASHCVKALLESGDPSLQIFRIFEEYISELTEDQVKSYKQFRDTHRVEELSVRKGNPLPQFLDNSKDLNNLLELRDIEDELTTIQKLIGEQQKVVGEMLKQYRVLNNTTGKGKLGTSFLMDLENTLDDYDEQVAGMLKSSEVAQQSYSQLLDMKQKHSNIIEAHMAREQTETAAEQSRSVMIFTIITIIFLPLSFFSSIFGMNVKDWSGTETNPTLEYVLLLMGFVSLGVILLALLAAFHGVVRKILLKTSRWMWKHIWGPFYKRVFGWSNLGRTPTGMSAHSVSGLGMAPLWDVEKGRLSSGSKWLGKKKSKGGEKGRKWGRVKRKGAAAVADGENAEAANGHLKGFAKEGEEGKEE